MKGVAMMILCCVVGCVVMCGASWNRVMRSSMVMVVRRRYWYGGLGGIK